MKGTYILLIYVNKDSTIQVGKKGTMYFLKGWYVYIGSALNSLESRIQRHLRTTKNLHWHIDYLLEHANVNSVYFKKGIIREECNVASAFSSLFSCIPRFGSSDCSCQSHLFFGPKETLQTMIDGQGFSEYFQ